MQVMDQSLLGAYHMVVFFLCTVEAMYITKDKTYSPKILVTKDFSLVAIYCLKVNFRH